ncbi:hypothetical protein HWC29_gp146 [Aeromonas phage 4_4572]|uniref:Uncharacterized protein n=1 Tax=Aeromonas phage 4_4572 TaxID=2588517 RepID=A0A5B9NAH9_9CAUD|nr:hypothetical protein HWC29_gp146 [Aeromonas phage 4_4572]QEG09040.1 hypothetical protein [Aeromonas phage 4_4572]
MKYHVRTNMDNTILEAHNFQIEGNMLVFRDVKGIAVAAVPAQTVRDIMAFNAIVTR